MFTSILLCSLWTTTSAYLIVTLYIYPLLTDSMITQLQCFVDVMEVDIIICALYKSGNCSQYSHESNHTLYMLELNSCTVYPSEHAYQYDSASRVDDESPSANCRRYRSGLQAPPGAYTGDGNQLTLTLDNSNVTMCGVLGTYPGDYHSLFWDYIHQPKGHCF